MLKTGEATYYFRVTRGPSYGSCSIVLDNRRPNDTFGVHCFEWKNKQGIRKLDTYINEVKSLS